MNIYLRKKIEERASSSALLQSMQKRAADDGRDLTDTERKTFDEIVDRLKDLDEQIKKISEFDASAAKFAQLAGAQSEAEEEAERAHKNAKPGDEDDDDDESEDATSSKQLVTRAAFGRRFVESTAFKSYRGAGTSDRVTLPGPASAEFRAAIMSGDVGLSAYTGPVPQVWAGPQAPRWSNVLLNLIGRVATSQAAVMYLTWTPQPPGDAAVVAEGQLKPEAVMDAVEATIALQTYAHYKAVTRQALEDIPQIQTIVQNRLLQGVASALEAAAVAALTGNANIPTVDGAGDLLTGIRVAIATVESNGFQPNAIALNPADAAALDMNSFLQTNNGAVRQGSAFGLPYVAARDIPVGSPYVGDFKTGETWFDRGNTDVYMSDSHSDFFLRNQLVVLAEARAAFAVTEPTALCKATAGVALPLSGGSGGDSSSQRTK